jgi:chlorobactene glucosyltransferase
VRRLLTHACAGVALWYAWRSLRILRGWVRVPEIGALADAPTLSIVVPARNEERNIVDCVRSLATQRGIDAEVIVVDDRSTDATRERLTGLQREVPALRVVDGAELPEGWVGKPWACAQGAAVARGAWLLFTDADSRHEPHASISTLAFARAHGVEAITIMTGQEMETFGEWAVLPAILGLVVFSVGPIERVNDPARPELALANGQYLMIERRAYDALGGHGAVRGEIVEDIEFARALKRDGRFRLLVAEGTGLVRVRMYHSFRELWDGFTKNMYLGARGNLVAIGAGMLFCASLSLFPAVLVPWSLRARDPLLAAEAALVPLVVVAVAAAAAPSASMPRRSACFAPFGIAVFAAIAANSTRRALTGQGFAWRGRIYGAKQSGHSSFGVRDGGERRSEP